MMENFLLNLLNTLNGIEVKGKDNLIQLATAIVAAEQELAKIQAENSTGEEGEIDGE